MTDDQQLRAIMAQMVAYENQARVAAAQLRKQCQGAIDPDCAGWLTSEAAAEVWHSAVVMLASLLQGRSP